MCSMPVSSSCQRWYIPGACLPVNAIAMQHVITIAFDAPDLPVACL